VERAYSDRRLVRLRHAATGKQEKTHNASQAIPNQRQSQFLFSSFNYSITDVVQQVYTRNRAVPKVPKVSVVPGVQIVPTTKDTQDVQVQIVCSEPDQELGPIA
jgi:hypothetical protein